MQRAGFLFSLECYKPLAHRVDELEQKRPYRVAAARRVYISRPHPSLRVAATAQRFQPQRNTLTERATAATPATPPTRDRKQNNCMPAETRPPRSVPSPPPKRRRDMPRADRGRQQLLDDLGYVQPIFRAGNSGDCTILKSVAVLLVVIGLVVFVGRFAE